MSVIVCEKSVMYVDCTHAVSSPEDSPERGLSPVRCPPRYVIDCTTPPETPEDARMTATAAAAKKRVREGDEEYDLALACPCPDAPRKARAVKQMMESPFARQVSARLFHGPISVRLICIDNGTIKVMLSYNNEWM